MLDCSFVNVLFFFSFLPREDIEILRRAKTRASVSSASPLRLWQSSSPEYQQHQQLSLTPGLLLPLATCSVSLSTLSAPLLSSFFSVATDADAATAATVSNLIYLLHRKPRSRVASSLTHSLNRSTTTTLLVCNQPIGGQTIALNSSQTERHKHRHRHILFWRASHRINSQIASSSSASSFAATFFLLLRLLPSLSPLSLFISSLFSHCQRIGTYHLPPPMSTTRIPLCSSPSPPSAPLHQQQQCFKASSRSTTSTSTYHCKR